MRNPGDRKRLRGFFFLSAFLLTLNQPLHSASASADKKPIRFAYVVGSWIHMPIGKFESPRGWVPVFDFYEPFQPEETVSLFDLGGKAGEVHVISGRRPDPNGIPIAWDAPIQKWTPSKGSEPYAVAVEGSWPAPAQTAEWMSNQDPQSMKIVQDVLTQQGVEVSTPQVTQALRLRLPGHESEPAIFITAASDPKALQDQMAGVRYALALMHVHHAGREKTFTLASQVSYKPANRTVEDHNRLYGTPDRDRFITFVDLNGDGQNEIVLCLTHRAAVTLEIFTWNGKAPRKVISVESPTDLF